MAKLHTIPARRGKAQALGRGQAIKIINTHGNQVVDTWAFVAGNMLEYMGMEQCRAFWGRLYPVAGDRMVSNRRRPILTLEEEPRPAGTIRSSRRATTNATDSSAAPPTTTTARDNLHAGLPGSVYIARTPRPRSTPS